MSKQKIFCEVEFYEKFISMRPNDIIPSRDNITKHRLWSNMFSFIDSSNIYFDDIREFTRIAKNNEFFKMLWKSSVYNPQKVQFPNEKSCDVRAFPEIDRFDEYDDEPTFMTSVLLTSKENSKCKLIKKSKGVIVISIDSIFELSYLFKSHKQNILSGSAITDWDFISRFRHPSNSMCIVDNYILSSEYVILKNLIPFLLLMLPKELSVTYHVSIFTLFDSNTGLEEDLIKITEDFITAKVKEKKPKLDLIVGIYKSSKRDFHDRAIITNNMILESGAGFDIFRTDKYNSTKTISIHKTTIHGYYSMFQIDLSSKSGSKNISMSDFLLSKCRNIHKKTNNKPNRLLEI